SKRIFTAVDARIFGKLMRWCRRRHPKKSGKWIKRRYFQREGHRDWVFTGTIRDSTGSARPIRLMQAAGGQGPTVEEDSECSQPLRSGMGTLPGGEVSLEADP